MANPIIRSIKEKTVSLVAENVTSGNICKHNKQGRELTYIVTYRQTGDAAPSAAEITDEGMIMFQEHPEQEKIESTTAIDVYVYANKEDTKTVFGKLVVWL